MAKYYDKNGAEITPGSTIRYPDGSERVVYLTVGELLGVDESDKNSCWVSPLSDKTCKAVEVVY